MNTLHSFVPVQLDFKDGVKLVKLRGEFMQQAAVPAGTGAMSAILRS